MAKLQWLLTRIVERIGLLGFINIVLFALIILVGFYIYLPKQEQLIRLQQQHDNNPVQLSKPVYEYRSSAELFFSSLPSINAVPAQLQVLFEQAKKNELFISEVQYKQQQLQGDGVTAYDITFSVLAGYPQIKVFIADALSQLPALALEQVTFYRDEVSVDTVTTQLRFRLFMVQS